MPVVAELQGKATGVKVGTAFAIFVDQPAVSKY